MKRFTVLTAVEFSIRCAVLSAACIFTAGPVHASSHREAPFITEMPKVDGADFYMFRSYEPGREDFVTLIADYQPLQDPAGGPNFYFMDEQAVYDINIDNDGDAQPDITFRFRFNNILHDHKIDVGGAMVSVPLFNTGPITADDNSALDVIETYHISVFFNGNPSNSTPLTNNSTGGTVFLKPTDNIGAKSIPDYSAYAEAHLYDIGIPGSDTAGRVFVGQRKEPFAIALGPTFDLLNLDPTGDPNGHPNALASKNITSLILEVPMSFLKHGNKPIIGGWTTASLHKTRVLRDNPTFDRPSNENGEFVQVSRVGMPLVNELLIGIKDKDRYNSSQPQDDQQFLIYFTNPTMPVLMNNLFGVTAPCLPRTDLIHTYLTGITNLNRPANVNKAEMLRLNTSIAPLPKFSQNNLGFIAGDSAGFPNGRRPGDDVVDITLRLLMGKLRSDSCAPDGQQPFTDGALVNDSDFSDSFPYLMDPLPGSP